MTNRVLLDNSGLKISKPGVDALVAADSQLLFSSDFSILQHSSLVTYSIPVSAWDFWYDDGTYEVWELVHTFYFPVAFSKPPFVNFVLQVKQGGSTHSYRYCNGFGSIQFDIGDVTGASGAEASLKLEVHNNRVRAVGYYKDTTLSSTNFVVRYRIIEQQT